MKLLVPVILFFLIAPYLFSQSTLLYSSNSEISSIIYDDSESMICSDWSIDIPASTWGISFGNSTNFNGFRFNFSDCDVETVNGFNFTLWKAKSVTDSEVNGISLGFISHASKLNGLNVGFALIAEEQMNGLNFAAFAAVSKGDIYGLNFGGLALISKGNITGINFGALGLGSGGDIVGLNLGGLALVANGNLSGINFSGLALVSANEIGGVNLGGLAIVGKESLYGLSVTLGQLQSNNEILGLSVAGYKTETYDFTGINFTIAWTEFENLHGFSFAAYNHIYGEQNGLTIGIVNFAEELNGLQFGLINIANNNSGIFKVLPFVNAHF